MYISVCMLDTSAHKRRNRLRGNSGNYVTHFHVPVVAITWLFWQRGDSILSLEF